MSASAYPINDQTTLASRHLPRRVRELLDGIYALAAKDIEPGLVSTLHEFEYQLARSAEHAHDKAIEMRWRENNRVFAATQSNLIPRFKSALETELANYRDPQIGRGQIRSRAQLGAALALMDDLEQDETSVLTGIAARSELRHSLPLYLLGQRFGVLAGRPGFDSETVPIGPKALCRMMRYATEALELDEPARVLLLRAFDLKVMPGMGALIDAVNLFLVENGVLPNMQFVPVRIIPRARTETDDFDMLSSIDLSTLGLTEDEVSQFRSARQQLRAEQVDGDIDDMGTRTTRSTRGKATAATATKGMEMQLIRHLLQSRRQLLEKLNPGRIREGRESAHPVNTDDLQAALRRLQLRPVAPVISNGKAGVRSIHQLKQDMLAALRQVSSGQEAPALSDQDNDSIDLLSMLYDNLMKDVKPGSPAANLLAKLQVPLLRTALKDQEFFTLSQHPARQMLNTIADTGAYWLTDEDHDKGLVEKLDAIVDRTTSEFDGEVTLFDTLLQDLVKHLQTVSHKAEVAERRYIDAARGKEKLALARLRASAAMDPLIKNHKLPRFTKTMLSQAWTDVMALTALRQGEDSDVWKQQLRIAERLVELSNSPEASENLSQADADTLCQDLEQALSQVGYQGSEAHLIAERLVDPFAISKDEGTSRTELTMRLKARARLGEDLESKKARRVPLTAEQKGLLERLKTLPLGTWFDFVTNEQGDAVRRRLSWYSAETGQALFVNHRGQKVAELSLDNLARMMTKNQLRIVEEEKGTIIDRAWSNVLGALHSFSTEKDPGASAP